MPFKSSKQRAWMWANKPDLAKRWTEKYGSKPRKKRKKKSHPAVEGLKRARG